MAKTTHQWIKHHTGLSREGQEIAFYLSHPEFNTTLDTLILGAFHGDEPESEVLVSRFMEIISPLFFQEKQIGIIPVVNPDGLAKNQRMNAANVDLNRNFPTHDWAELNPETIYYSGPSAGSEPETQFLLDILTTYSPQKIISVHTPYKVINYDGPAERLAQVMAEKNGYPVVEDIGYSTPGSFGTYVGKERQIPTITLELPDQNFDEAEILKNIEALKAAIAENLNEYPA